MNVSLQSVTTNNASHFLSFGRRRRKKRTSQTTSSTQGLGHEAKRTATQAIINGVVNIAFKYAASQFGLPI